MPYPGPTAYAQPATAATPAPWKWTYSRWVGIMYGPIPVGLIIAAVILIAIYGNK